MRALSGLTPALSRRLQRQLLAHLPPAAARSLRRTLSLHDPAAPAAAAASAASAPAADPGPRSPSADRSSSLDPDSESSVRQFCTLPRLRRRASRERSPPSPAPPSASEASGRASPPGERRTRDRPLLSKYLTPERALSLDDPRSEDAAAGAGPPARRHSARLAGEAPRRRVSRFLRSDFFDAPPAAPDETAAARRRRERELETQEILREIREKRTRSLEAAGARGPADADEAARRCLSPGAPSAVLGKERSRSTTPFLPILDNIRETAADTSPGERRSGAASAGARPTSRLEDGPPSLSRESRLLRPRSYPVKDLDSGEDSAAPPAASARESDGSERSSQRESRLIRPRSYPTGSPSPEKVYVNRGIGRREDSRTETLKEEVAEAPADLKGDVEVSFSITLPRKKSDALPKVDSLKSSESSQQRADVGNAESETANDSLVIKKYQVVSDSAEKTADKVENGTIVANGGPKDVVEKANLNSDKSNKVTSKKDEAKSKSTDGDSGEKKTTVKKKIIRKVSSKTKTDVGSSQETGETKAPTEKKKVTKKVKEKTTEDGSKSTVVTKKKSMLQSIGHKLEKFATKSSSPEKTSETSTGVEKGNEVSKINRTQREQSVPVSAEPPTESNLIKRAVTLTDVAALETQNTNNTKTTVSKVLGLFKKFEPKDKPPKPIVEKSQSENLDVNPVGKPETVTESGSDSPDKDKPRRPTSLLLNGLGRKNKYGRTASDSVSVTSVENEDQPVLKKESEPKNLRNTLKLDFSRLPRVKKIVPTNPVIEPQIMNASSENKDVDKKIIIEKNGTISDGISNADLADAQNRSRSRSRSTVSEQKSDLSADGKSLDKHSVSPDTAKLDHQPFRNHESTTPEKEDIVDRIRRKSFYSRFNEKKQRRKSNLVGPGAAEYDPLSRIHSPPVETKFDASPTSPTTYDLSPGYSISSDLSPSTERYRTLLADLPLTSRNNLRYDTYGLNDKMDTYRSLDRNEFRKYPGSRSYLDYDQPSSYGTNRYSRTKSLLDSSEGTEESYLGHIRDPQKYNRTLSMYSPGSYATYRPKRTLNSAIILKESEKEPSPENILEKIRQRKTISISVTRKPDSGKDPLPRSIISPKGEGDGAECSEKTD